MNDGTANLLNPETRGKNNGINRKLSLIEKRTIAEYLRTGNKTAAYSGFHKTKKKWASQVASQFFKRPRIVSALEKALKDSKFDDAYAVKQLKDLIDAGMANRDITKPDVALKGLETFWKLTKKLGSGNNEPLKIDPETAAKKMDTSQLQAALKELNKQEKRIMDILKNGNQPPTEEGEVLK